MPVDRDYFSGGIFSDDLPGGRAGAELRFTPDHVVATMAPSDAAPQGRTFSIPFSQSLLEIGGYNGRMVFCRTADGSLTIFSDERGFAQELARAAGGLLDEQLQTCAAKRRATTRRSLLGGLVLTGLVAAVLVASFYGIRMAADLSIAAVPLAVDHQVGEQAFLLMDRGGQEIRDPVVIEAVEQLVDRLAPHAAIDGLNFHVHVIDADLCNAFCLPGGTIVLYTGLLRRASSPEEVAGVLAHEMAHASLRHGLRQVSQSVGIAAAVNLLIGNVEGLVVAGAEVFKLATINSYSRAQEAAADTEGVRMLHAASINPMSLAHFFDTLQRETGNLPPGLTWLSTHPDHAARIGAVREQVGTLAVREYVAFDIDWAAVRKRAGAN